MTARFSRRFTATPESIDELGHVNNAVWVQWIQTVATDHWQAVAPPDQQAAHVWVVVRHEIDYRRALGPGEQVTARTWVADTPRGATFDRFVEFVGDDGRVHVSARTSWALLDRASGRPLRVTQAVMAPFRAACGAADAGSG